MKATPFRAASAIVFALYASVVIADPATAGSVPDQDTSNGVAPVKPDAAAASPAAPKAPEAGPPPAPIAAPPPAPSEAQRYCENIAAVAAEARFAWQTRKLNELQAQVSQKVAELEKKQAELQDSLTRRDEAMKRAQATLLAIYAKMQPDSAAAQLSALDDETASAILAQLNPRQASAILNEIVPARAGRLISTMTSLPAPEDKTDGKKS